MGPARPQRLDKQYRGADAHLRTLRLELASKDRQLEALRLATPSDLVGLQLRPASARHKT
jgi:hypothetical protein